MKPSLRQLRTRTPATDRAARDAAAYRLAAVHADGYADYETLAAALDRLTAKLRAGRGVVVRCRALKDRLIKRWCFERRLSYRVCHPEDGRAGAEAARDADMIAKSSALAAFGGGREIGALARLARQAGKKVREYR